MQSRRRLVPKAPSPSSAAVTAVMRGNTREGTRPEIIVRQLLHRMGYRYRLHSKNLPGRPDIVFSSRHIVIQVNGCFWHQHPERYCPLQSKPRSNRNYWDAKLRRNVMRDEENREKLNALGWTVLVIWECQCSELKGLMRKLMRALGPPNRRTVV